MLKRITLIYASLLLTAFSSYSQVVINEYCAANMNDYTDAFGRNEDWFEIYNSGGGAVDLTGWYVSDKAGNPLKWIVPSGTVPAGGYAIVVCSGRSTVSGNEIHAGLKLTQTAPEDIILSDATGTLVDQITLSPNQADHSMGRTTDGAATWSVFTNPTPGASNTGGFTGYATKPIFDQAPGYHTGSVTVGITTPDPNITIHYTLDGSAPTAASTVYGSAITINNTSVLRAIAISSDPNILSSFIETNTYIIDTTHTMAILSICGTDLADLIEDGNGWGANFDGAIEYFGPDGIQRDEGAGHYNKHGNDSWAYDQRGFDFIMRDQMGYNHGIRYPIFRTKNRDEFQRLIVKAAANDNYPAENGAHIRDSYVHALSHEGELLMDERTFEPCILYLNGRYWGVYDIREKVDDNDFTDHYYGQSVPYSGSEDHVWFLKTWGGTWEEYGAPVAQPAWDALRTYINANNMAPGPAFDYVDSLYNWRSLVDYFCLNSYIVSQDWLNWNTAWWRGTDTLGTKKKWRYVLWDMDASFGHYINYTGIPDPTANADPCNAENLPDPGGQGHTTILTKLIQENPDVEQYYKSRYIDLGNTVFSCDNMIHLLDSLTDLIAPEMQGQVDKWGGTVAGWQGNVQTLRDFITARCVAMEQGLVDCYQLTGPYDITFDVDPPGAGEIKVNSIWLDQYPFTGTYYGNIDILLKARANNGYVFKEWTATDPVNPISDSTDVDMQVTQNQTITAHFVEEGDPTYDGVYLPTAFSPNSDGNNDWYFVLAGADVAAVEINIYDRWGQVMYNSSDITDGWNGTGPDGTTPLNSGVYTIIVDVTYTDSKTTRVTGNITLIR